MNGPFLYISNSSFDRNSAGTVGGAVFYITSQLVVRTGSCALQLSVSTYGDDDDGVVCLALHILQIVLWQPYICCLHLPVALWHDVHYIDSVWGCQLDVQL